MLMEQKIEQQKIKNLKTRLKQKKKEVVWGRKKTKPEKVEVSPKGATQEDQLRSLTRGLGQLKNKMKSRERISEQSSEEPILVRVTSKPLEQNESGGPSRGIKFATSEEPIPRFYVDEEPILKTARKFGNNEIVSVKSKKSGSKESESKKDVEVISVGGNCAVTEGGSRISRRTRGSSRKSKGSKFKVKKVESESKEHKKSSFKVMKF